MDLYGWGDQDEDLLFAQDASVSGQPSQQWKPRTAPQETALREVANSELRRLLACIFTFNCTDVKIWDSVLSYKAPHRRADRSGGGLQASSMSMRRELARDTKVRPPRWRDVVCANEWLGRRWKGRMGRRYNPLDSVPACAPLLSGNTPGVTERKVAPRQGEVKGKEGVPEISSEGAIEGEGQRPITVDSSTWVPDSSPISFQLPPSPSPFGRNCAPSQGPAMDSGCLDTLSYGHMRHLCKQHGYHRKDLREVLNTRLASTTEQNASSTRDARGNLDAPLTGAG